MLVPVDVLFLGDTELWKCLTWAWVSLLLSWGHVGLAWERKVMGWKVEFGSRAHECESFRCSVGVLNSELHSLYVKLQI